MWVVSEWPGRGGGVSPVVVTFMTLFTCVDKTWRKGGEGRNRE